MERSNEVQAVFDQLVPVTLRGGKGKDDAGLFQVLSFSLVLNMKLFALVLFRP